MKAQGFTLAEVLVALAIVAVLAALLISSYSASVQQAKTVVCVSNLKQLHAAMLLYNDDYGRFPPMSEKWPGLKPYLGNTDLTCPFRDVAQPAIEERLRVSYFIHAFFDDREDPIHRADAECMEERAGSYPVGHDSNHRSSPVASSVGSAFYLFVRMDGSVARKSVKEAERFFRHPMDFPCPRASFYSNF